LYQSTVARFVGRKIAMPYSHLRYLTGLLLLMFVSLMLSACNGGGSGDTASSGTGSVAFLITDGPAADFDEINITVNRAELFCDSGHATVFQGSKTFNLLDLADNGRIFAAGDNIPAGSCSKIRLTLSQIELIQRDGAGNITLQEYPRLPGNGKLDLVPRSSFYISPGETVVIQIDMDANKSIHIVETGSGKYQFRPVVFVDVIGGQFPGKFLRVHGVISDIDDTAQKFSLCKSATAPAGSLDSDYEGCIDVSVTDITSIFDQAGEPVGFDQLVSGDEATVYGRLRRDDDDEDVTPQNEYAEGLDDLELVAQLIELGPEGTFQRYSGTAENAADAAGQFSMLTDPETDTRVTVQTHIETKIISRQGKMLTVDDIAPGVPMMLEGVTDDSVDPNLVSAAFIVLDLDGMHLQKLSGIVNVNPAAVCGGTGLSMNDGVMDRDVQFSTDTRAFLVSTEPGGGFITEQVPLSAILSGQSIDVYGAEGGDGCFNAQTIIAFE
jgi:hypothetical protein